MEYLGAMHLGVPSTVFPSVSSTRNYYSQHDDNAKYAGTTRERSSSLPRHAHASSSSAKHRKQKQKRSSSAKGVRRDSRQKLMSNRNTQHQSTAALGRSLKHKSSTSKAKSSLSLSPLKSVKFRRQIASNKSGGKKAVGNRGKKSAPKCKSAMFADRENSLLHASLSTIQEE